jgi:dihydropteroate synthase
MWWARFRPSSAWAIDRDRIVLDPGLGFAKVADQSLQALAGLGRLGTLGYPILCGPSRKSFLKVALGDLPPSERIWGTAAAVAVSVMLGAHIVRVHDVREMVQVVRVADEVASRVAD